LGVEFSDDALSVSLRDGRVITVPLVWYPRLLNATTAQRKNWKVAGGGYGLHWPDVDEDLSTEGLLRGAPAPKVPTSNFKAKNGLVLSKREQHIASLIAQGLTNREIASRLRVSEPTVRTHIQKMLSKLGARDRFAIVDTVAQATSATRDAAR
jgi:DNA-binding CsgD family transcriptional regulator